MSKFKKQPSEINYTLGMKRYMLWVLSLSLLLEGIEATILIAVIPDVAANFGVAPIKVRFAAMAYLIAMGLGIPLGAWLAELYGQKRIYLSAVALFLFGCLLCGYAQNLSALIVARIIQAWGASMIMPVVRIIVFSTYEDVSKIMSYITVPVILGPLLGPTFGGVVATLFTWRMIFIYALPVCVILFVLGYLVIPNKPKKSVPNFDWAGCFFCMSMALLAVIGFSLMMVMQVWPLLLGLSIVFWLGMRWLYQHVKHHENPYVHPLFFEMRHLKYGFWSHVIFKIADGGSFLLIIFYFKLALGFSSITTGALIAVMAFAMLLGRYCNQSLLPHTIRIHTTVLLGYCLMLVILPIFNTSDEIGYIVLIMAMKGFCAAIVGMNGHQTVFAPVEKKMIKHLISFNSAALQWSLCMGIMLTALGLHMAQPIPGVFVVDVLTCHWVFLCLACLALLSVLPRFCIELKKPHSHVVEQSF